MGLGFFHASKFFPDFLLWTQDCDQVHFIFVDPKGLHHFTIGDPKVQFITRDVPRIQEIVAGEATDLSLHAFILSNTPYSNLG